MPRRREEPNPPLKKDNPYLAVFLFHPPQKCVSGVVAVAAGAAAAVSALAVAPDDAKMSLQMVVNFPRTPTCCVHLPRSLLSRPMCSWWGQRVPVLLSRFTFRPPPR